MWRLWNGKRRKLPGESTISHVVVLISLHSFAFSRIHCCLFMLQLHYQGNLLKRITITQNLKEIKDVRGPATEMIISPWQAGQAVAGRLARCHRGGAWSSRKKEEEEPLLPLLRSLARHCSIPREEAEREAAIFIWPPCASLAPLSVTNGQVVNRKKAQKRKRER